MSAQPDELHTAQIVDMSRLLDSSGRRRDVLSDEQRGTAQLLSIRQSLRYQASVGLSEIDKLQAACSKAQLDGLYCQVRRLLDVEFGKLRVYRHRKAFSVGHYNVEGLIAGLLRIQYHARQIRLPALDAASEPQMARARLSLDWGVGATILDADNERLRRLSRR